MTTFPMSKTPPRGSGSPVGWGRGDEPIGPGNWRGPSGPPDNRPPTASGPPSKGFSCPIIAVGYATALAWLTLAPLVPAVAS